MPSYTVVRAEDELTYEVESQEDGTLRVLTPEGDVLELSEHRWGEDCLHMLIAGRSVRTFVREGEGGVFDVDLWGEHHSVEVLNERQRRMRVAGVGGRKESGPELTSPMAGKVVVVPVAVGQQVEEGETVVIIEAMKMENDLKAHRPGVIGEVRVDVGDAVEIDDVLVVIEDSDPT